ncbi:MAG: type II secretion system F family protein [Kiritimatiellae bacterium]|nr:type II secretion system F family protein [Kiritimatiellia bacterium]MDW8458955.1 type II secretion system F family protein [Verrucomicrobiota bacterium]
MKTFAYRGYTRGGTRVRGIVEAIGPKEAREKLIAREILPERIEPAAGAAGRSRIPASKRAALYRELGSLIRAGVPLENALSLLGNTYATGAESHGLASARDRIREGVAPDDALAASLTGMTPFEAALLQAGRRSGRLGESMEQLAGYLENEERLREGIKSALIYPFLVLLLGLLIGVVVILVLFPRLASLFEETGADLPSLTRALIWMGRDGRNALLASVLAAAAGVMFGARAISRPAARKSLELRAVRIPLFGSLLRLSAAARFGRTLALCIRGGVQIPDAFPLAGRASGMRSVEEASIVCAEEIRQGKAPADALGRCPIVGDLLVSWYCAGEASGDPATLLEQAANQYYARWENLVQRMLRLIEPLLILLVGAMVLVVAVGILLPVLSLNQISW